MNWKLTVNVRDLNVQKRVNQGESLEASKR